MWVSKKEWDEVVARVAALERGVVVEKGTGEYETSWFMGMPLGRVERTVKLPLAQVVKRLMEIAGAQLEVDPGQPAIEKRLLVVKGKNRG